MNESEFPNLDFAAMRKRSWQSVEKQDLPRNDALPLVPTDLELQPIGSIANRMLCMSVVAAYAFGFPAASTGRWLDQEGLSEELSHSEMDFLSGAEERRMALQMQVHALYALCWCTSLVEGFSINGQIPDDLVHRLPDLRRLESSEAFRARLVLRPKVEVLPQLDEAYCFHWAWREELLSSNRNRRVNNLHRRWPAPQGFGMGLHWRFLGRCAARHLKRAIQAVRALEAARCDPRRER